MTHSVGHMCAYVIDLLEQAQYFVDFSGYESVANDISAAIDSIAKLKMKKMMSAKQSHYRI